MGTKIYRLTILAAIGALLLGACASAVPTTPAPAVAAPTLAAPTQAAPAVAAPTQAAATAAIPASGGTVTPASGSVTFKVVSGSTADYRVREQLAHLSLPSDAVGKTNAISGQITILPDGAVDSHNSKFTVDVSTLVSDQARRDGFVSQNILQTGQYPQAVFVPTRISGLNGIPQPGNQVSFQLAGDLTVRNVTKPVTWDVTGAMNNDNTANAQATTNFTFGDFNLSQPQVPVVLSVVDKITLEVNLQLQKVSP